MLTIEQIEQVAVAVYAGVTDVADVPSQTRMKAITDVYASMLASRTTKIDEETLEPNTQQLIAHFLKQAQRNEAEALT